MTLTREEVGGDQGVFGTRVNSSSGFKRHGRLLLAAALAAGVFVVDVRLPRTAIPAICYSGILALVASSGVRRIIMPCALLFTALTWAGAVLEPAPAPAEAGALWASVIDRAMVSGVLWLTALLMLRREQSLAELEKLSRELARRNAELDQFAGVVAHDVRSPLATASLYAQLLERTDPADREEVAQCHEVIARSLGEMEELIRDLLEATRRPQARADCDTQAVLNPGGADDAGGTHSERRAGEV
jgi:signal transduction histidine kinase